MLTIREMKMYANKFLKENYNMNLTIPIELNGRMKRTCGWFKFEKYPNGRVGKSVKIELNKFFTENNTADVVLDVLRHELVHYALFEQQKPFSDGDRYFEAELKRLGVVSQSNIDKYTIQSKPRNVTLYKCLGSCGKTHELKRKLKNDGMFHKCRCGGKLKSLGKKLVAN